MCQNFLLLMIKMVRVLFTMRFSTLLHKKRNINNKWRKKQEEEENTEDMNILARLPKKQINQ